MEKDKYHDFDKSMSKNIMKEFEGKTVEHECTYCNGSGKIESDAPCENCKGEGFIIIKY